MKGLLCIAFVFLTYDLGVLAGPCVGITLQDYISAGSCVDAAGITLADFSFSVVSSGGGATPIGAADIKVLLWPALTSGGIGDTDGVEFVFNNAGVSGTGFINYQIGFTFDPSGDLRDILDPGLVDINTGLCVGSAFVGGVCPVGFTLNNAHVFEGATSQLVDTIPGSASPTIWGVQNNISLSANGGTASFYGLENDVLPVFTPEPDAGLMVVGGLAFLLLRGLWVRRVRANG